MRVDYSRASREELIAIIEMQERWHLAARFDPLTGVLNREGILERLKTEMSRTGREGRPLGVALADVDDFHRISKENGRQCGEHVLSAVADRIRRVLRDYDAVGRIGADEFLILAPGAGTGDLATLCGRMRAAVARHPLRWGGRSLPAGVVLGAVAYRGGFSSETLLSSVHAALMRSRNHDDAGGA
jgi:diguanylate cyclase (GGDEF)-like protein